MVRQVIHFLACGCWRAASRANARCGGVRMRRASFDLLRTTFE